MPTHAQQNDDSPIYVNGVFGGSDPRDDYSSNYNDDLNDEGDGSDNETELEEFYYADEPNFMIYQLDGKPRLNLRADEYDESDPDAPRDVYNLAGELIGQIIGELPTDWPHYDPNDPTQRSLSPDDSGFIPPHDPDLFGPKYYYTLPEGRVVDFAGTFRDELTLKSDKDGLMVYGPSGPVARPSGNLPDRLVGVDQHPHDVKFYYRGDGPNRQIYSYLGRPCPELTPHPAGGCVLYYGTECRGWLEGELPYDMSPFYAAGSASLVLRPHD